MLLLTIVERNIEERPVDCQEETAMVAKPARIKENAKTPFLEQEGGRD
jgi:hypothetical protein